MAHVAFVSYEIAPATAGGVGVFVAGIAEALVRDGHRVSLLLDIPQADFRRWVDHGQPQIKGAGHLESFWVDGVCDDLQAARTEFPSEAQWRSYRFAHGIRHIHARKAIDLAEFFDYCGPAYYALIQRALDPARSPGRIAVRLHNTIEIIDRRTGSAFAPFRVYDYAMERAALLLADLVLTPGMRYWRAEAASLYPVPDRRVQPSFPVRRHRSRVPGAGGGRDVVFIGRVSTFKGMDRLMHAAVAALADPALSAAIGRFVMIGPEETVSSSTGSADILAIGAGLPPDRLVLPGRLDEAGIAGYLAHAAVAVFPNRMESFCYAAHEAHMAGVPLILSDTPAFRDHFTEGQSALFFDGSVHGLVAALRACMADAELRARLSASVEPHRARYERHDYDRHLRATPFAPPPGTEAAEDVSVFVLAIPGTADAAGALQAARELARALPAAQVRALLPAASGLQAFGQSWSLHDPAGAPVLAQAELLRPCVVVLSADAGARPDFIRRACRMLAAEPRLGAVIPARLDEAGGRAATDAAIALDRQPGTEIRLLSAVMAPGRACTLVDLLTDPAATTELTALAALRAHGRVLVDDPDASPGAAIRHFPPESHARARFLRQHAWSLDPVLLANDLAELAGIESRIATADPSVALAAMLDRTRQDSALFVLAIPATDPAAARPNQVSLLSVRRHPAGPPIRWTEGDWHGDWTRISVWDRPSGIQVGRGGALALAGATDPEVAVGLGPDQGRAVFLWRGRAISVDLTAARPATLVLRASAVAAHLLPDNAAGFPVLSAAAIGAGAEIAGLQAALARSHGRVVLVAHAQDAPVARAMAPASAGLDVFTVSPALLATGGAAQAIAQGFGTWRGRSGGGRLALFGSQLMLGLAAEVLDHDPGLAIAFYLQPGIAWSSGGWETMRSAAALAARAGGRLTLHALPGGVTEALRQLGATVVPCTLCPPACRIRPQPGPVALILAPPPRDIPTLGHAAAAAAEVLRLRDHAVATVFVPASDEERALRLLDAYGFGSRVRSYEDASAHVRQLAGTRFIYCYPFPDGSLPGAALTAIEHGGLVLVAPGGLSRAADRPPDHQAPRAPGILTVTLWEDSMVLAARLCEAVDRYAELQEPLPAEAVVLAG